MAAEGLGGLLGASAVLGHQLDWSELSHVIGLVAAAQSPQQVRVGLFHTQRFIIESVKSTARQKQRPVQSLGSRKAFGNLEVGAENASVGNDLKSFDLKS